MTMQDLDAAVALIRRHADQSHVLGPQDENRIARAEAALGLPLPPTYRRFVQEFGAGSFAGQEFYGVVGDDFARSSVPDAIWYAVTGRREGWLPETFIPVGDDSMGGLYVIDTAQRGPDGESPVLIIQPSTTLTPHRREVVAPDFGAFLRSCAEAALGPGT